MKHLLVVAALAASAIPTMSSAGPVPMTAPEGEGMLVCFSEDSAREMASDQPNGRDLFIRDGGCWQYKFHVTALVDDPTAPISTADLVGHDDSGATYYVFPRTLVPATTPAPASRNILPASVVGLRSAAICSSGLAATRVHEAQLREDMMSMAREIDNGGCTIVYPGFGATVTATLLNTYQVTVSDRGRLVEGFIHRDALVY